MDILENREQWLVLFRQSWLAHYQRTGQISWVRYPPIINTRAPAGPGLDLRDSRLMLIASAGGYLPGFQTPFNISDPGGDYSLRLFPSSTAPEQLAFAHAHYDHSAVNADPQVLIPLNHLRTLVAEGVIGALTPSVVSIMGYQPDATRVVDETIPAICQVARAEQAQAALLVPA